MTIFHITIRRGRWYSSDECSGEGTRKISKNVQYKPSSYKPNFSSEIYIEPITLQYDEDSQCRNPMSVLAPYF